MDGALNLFQLLDIRFHNHFYLKLYAGSHFLHLCSKIKSISIILTSYAGGPFLYLYDKIKSEFSYRLCAAAGGLSTSMVLDAGGQSGHWSYKLCLQELTFLLWVSFFHMFWLFCLLSVVYLFNSGLKSYAVFIKTILTFALLKQINKDSYLNNIYIMLVLYCP